MNEIQQLELLTESIQNEIDELQSLLENSDDVLLKAKRTSFQNELKNIISNLRSANDAVYGVFEDLNSDNCDYKDLENDFDILHDILQEKLSHEEKVHMRIKYKINF